MILRTLLFVAGSLLSLAPVLCAQEGDPRQRTRTVRELAKMGPDAIPRLAPYVSDPDTSVRVETVKALVGDKVLESKRCCGESGGLAYARPDIATQIRYRKEQEILAGEKALREQAWVSPKDHVKVLTSCPSCLIGLNRFQDDLQNGLLEADYIVVEMAKQLLGEQWLPAYVQQANAGGIERVLV